MNPGRRDGIMGEKPILDISVRLIIYHACTKLNLWIRDVKKNGVETDGTVEANQTV